MQHRTESGFTLLEALIAALILLIAIVFVAQLFVTALQQNRTSRENTHATAIAQSKLEELNAMPLEKLVYGGDLGKREGADDKPGTPGYVDYVAVDDVDSDKIGVVPDKASANYVRFWKIEPDPGGWDGMYRISVRVVALRPGTASGREEVTLSTIRALY
jgi:type II secretory pathway pseudopilin PulG